VRLDAKQACEDLSVAGSSELITVDVVGTLCPPRPCQHM